MPQPGSPTSLVKPDADAGDARRAISNLDVSAGGTGDMPEPTDPTTLADKLEGFNTRGARWLHLLVELLDAGAGVDFQLWLFDENARRWHLDIRLGTDGTVTIASTDADYPKSSRIIEIAGAKRAYLRLLNDTGTWGGDPDTDGANAWLSGVNEQ